MVVEAEVEAMEAQQPHQLHLCVLEINSLLVQEIIDAIALLRKHNVPITVVFCIVTVISIAIRVASLINYVSIFKKPGIHSYRIGCCYWHSLYFGCYCYCSA